MTIMFTVTARAESNETPAATIPTPDVFDRCLLDQARRWDLKLTQFRRGVGDKEKEFSKCPEPIHHTQRNTGVESLSWRVAGAASPRWRVNSSPQLRRSASGSNRLDSMKDCTATA